MKIVFTGTRDGMTPEQKLKVKELLERCEPTLIFHGGCMGADWDFHWLALLQEAPITVFPSNMPGTYPPEIREAIASGRTLESAWLDTGGDEVCKPRPPLERNKRMIALSSSSRYAARLIACPKAGDEERIRDGRGGTLATIREAGRRGVVAEIVAADGRHWSRI